MKEFLKTCLHSSVKMWINLLAVINLLPCLIPLFSERHLWRLQEDVAGPHLIIIRNTFAMPTIKTCLKERKFIKNLCKYDKKIKKRVLKLMNFYFYSTKTLRFNDILQWPRHLTVTTMYDLELSSLCLTYDVKPVLKIRLLVLTRYYN